MDEYLKKYERELEVKKVASNKMLMIRNEISPKIKDILIELIQDGVSPYEAIYHLNDEIEALKFEI